MHAHSQYRKSLRRLGDVKYCTQKYTCTRMNVKFLNNIKRLFYCNQHICKILKTKCFLTCPAVLPSIARCTARGTTSGTDKTRFLVICTVTLSLTLQAERARWTGVFWNRTDKQKRLTGLLSEAFIQVSLFFQMIVSCVLLFAEDKLNRMF